MFGELMTVTYLHFFIGFALSILAGILIGIEKESQGKDAGIGTHTLVITGSMMFTFYSILVDPMSTSRIAAQVVTGVGFLGAGLIIKDGFSIKNLTTAANIWFAAAIGMAFGFRFYLFGICGMLLAIFIYRVPHIKKNHN